MATMGRERPSEQGTKRQILSASNHGTASKASAARPGLPRRVGVTGGQQRLSASAGGLLRRRGLLAVPLDQPRVALARDAKLGHRPDPRVAKPVLSRISERVVSRIYSV